MSLLLPGSTIAVLGGGQLGRMLAFEARRMGYRTGVIDPSIAGPMAQVADFSISATFDNAQAAHDLAAQADVVTVETELIPWTVLSRLEALKPVRPAAQVLRTIQDRLTQKDFLRQHAVPLPTYAPVHDQTSLAQAAQTVPFPAVLKLRRSGYDGRGQAKVERPPDLGAAWDSLGQGAAVLEAFIPFVQEISVVLARNTHHEVAVYPLAENVHRRHILHTSRVPAHIPERTAAQATALAVRIAQALNHYGVMAVEMFVLADGTVLVNEIAPRTHNSGHYTYGACSTSQFEQHLRAICGLPLGSTTLLSPVVMVNLLGDAWQNGGPYWEHLLRHPQARLHLYGKSDARPGRKMGHFLLLDADTDASLELADTILAQLTSTVAAQT